MTTTEREITSTETWTYEGDTIVRDVSDLSTSYAERLTVNGDKGRWICQGPHGLHEVMHNGYAYFSEYWTGFLPVNQLVKLVNCQKVS